MKSAGRYEILGRLGRGGMSTVYKAKAPITERIVALKILRPRDEIFVDLVGEKRLKEIFLEEARIMGSITHEHVAKVIDCDEHDGDPFIVLEYYSHSLGDFIGEAYKVEQDSRIVSIPRTYLYMHQALRGLERLHFAGIIHRDIKPFNLMLTTDDRLKIIDFGLSRVRGEENMAIPGMQVGSPYYAAPEQTKNPDAIDGRADLYSLGVMMYRMLTGKLPVKNFKEQALPSQLNDDLSTEWDEFLLTSLARKPEERFSSSEEMRKGLEDVYLNWKINSEESCSFCGTAVSVDVDLPFEMTDKPGRIMYKEIRSRLNLDELFRPNSFFEHQLEVVDSELLYDPVTKLFWQRNGAGFPLNFRQAKKYVHALNESRFLGKTTWRLPTSAELTTVLRSPTISRDFCIDPKFDPTIHWLWSADHSTKKAAWVADIVESHIGRLDMDGNASVCAVSA